MSSFKCIKQLLLSSAVLTFMGSAHAPTPAHVAPPAAHPSAVAMTFNQHLHLPAPAAAARPATPVPASHATELAAAARPGAEHPLHPFLSLLTTHTNSARRWDPHAYIALHRGLARIEGEVRTGAGQPAGGVRVALRKPKARIFASVARRHITYTAPDGTFTMTDVRPGTYRVFASENKKHGSSREAVHAGSVTKVAVKL